MIYLLNSNHVFFTSPFPILIRSSRCPWCINASPRSCRAWWRPLKQRC